MFINAFLAFHIAAIACWALPLNTGLIPKAREVIAPYMLWSGLFQAWDMFAPDPAKVNGWIEGVVTLRDGKTAVWRCPRMHQLGLMERYAKERYRKFGNERLRLDAHSALWPDAARYIARLFNDPANPPVSVQLVRHWTMVPPPSADGREQPQPVNTYAYFTYPVKQEDLR
jgi:hypothetical protein